MFIPDEWYIFPLHYLNIANGKKLALKLEKIKK